jgi:hypothetical protein
VHGFFDHPSSNMAGKYPIELEYFPVLKLHVPLPEALWGILPTCKLVYNHH